LKQEISNQESTLDDKACYLVQKEKERVTATTKDFA